MPHPTSEAHVLPHGTPTVPHPSTYSLPGAHAPHTCSITVSPAHQSPL